MVILCLPFDDAKTASANSHHRNMDSLHGQLGQLLNDAQALLADIAPGASGSQFGKIFRLIYFKAEITSKLFSLSLPK